MSKSINLDAEDRRVRFLQDLLLRKSGRGPGGEAETGPARHAAAPDMAPAAALGAGLGAGPVIAAAPAPAAPVETFGGAEAPSGPAFGAASGTDRPSAPGGLAADASRFETRETAPAGAAAGFAIGFGSGPAADDAADETDHGTGDHATADATAASATDLGGGDMAGDGAEAHAPPAPFARIEQIAPNPAAPSAEEAAAAAVAAADQARAARRAKQRTRTRLIGFDASGPSALDPLAGQAAAPAPSAAAAAAVRFPVGWIVVIDGPGRGESFALASGLNQIGRGEEQQVRLDFGDDTISRENHASIAFDEETRTCYLGHGGKSNLVRRNGRPVLSTEELGDGDVIRVGETTLKFKALCGADFSWSDRSKVTRLANG